VSAATPAAALAGQEVLDAGGNAIDAAVAVSFALAVTEPFGSGLGGQTVMLVHPAGGEPFIIGGASRAPEHLPENVTGDDLAGRRASTVPNTVSVLGLAWRSYGSGKVAWPQLLAPAIRCAEQGYSIGKYQERVLRRFAAELRSTPGLAALFLRPDGSIPQAGSRFRQPVLARTLRRLARHGAEDFYTGTLADEITEDMQEFGGWITRQDLGDRLSMAPP
jgi:gamma-glutamyltranspeptidase/glutathione hydrolase